MAGAEADFSWADLSGSGRTTATYGCGTICSTTVNWFATERARLGYAFDNGVLLYATGGAAQVDVRPDLDGYIRSSTRFGWAAGAGVEYRFNRNWSAKAEYLFVNVDDYVWTNATNGLIDCRGLNCSTELQVQPCSFRRQLSLRLGCADRGERLKPAAAIEAVVT